MIYFFYGEDTYRIKEKTDALRRAFLDKQGSDLNLSIFNGKDLSFDIFKNAASQAPFLGDKRFIIIKNLIIENNDKEVKKKIAESLDKLPDFSVLLFIEEGLPDKRESLFKKLEKTKAEVFLPLEGSKLISWIEGKFRSFDLEIDRQALMKLSICTGSDLWKLNNEISKISNFVSSQGRQKVIAADIDLFVEPVNSYRIFDLTDALAVKNINKAMKVLTLFRKDGEESLKIINLIITQLRNMLVIQDQIARKESTSILGLHPFVVKKTTDSIRNFKRSDLEKIYRNLAEYDYKIKNGIIEPDLALEMIVVDFCQK
jgi:DNA polymerase-3 subunit delta